MTSLRKTLYISTNKDLVQQHGFIVLCWTGLPIFHTLPHQIQIKNLTGGFSHFKHSISFSVFMQFANHFTWVGLVYGLVKGTFLYIWFAAHHSTAQSGHLLTACFLWQVYSKPCACFEKARQAACHMYLPYHCVSLFSWYIKKSRFI